MFDPCRKSTGTEYSLTVALLAVAFIFSPAVLVASRPFGCLSVSLAVACSAMCVTLAWVSWKRSSQLSIPLIAIQSTESK